MSVRIHRTHIDKAGMSEYTELILIRLACQNTQIRLARIHRIHIDKAGMSEYTELILIRLACQNTQNSY